MQQSVEQGGADVAGHHHASAGSLNQQRRHRRGGGLAIGARDGNDLRRVVALLFQRSQGLCKKIQLGQHGHARSPGRSQQRGHARVIRWQPRALENKLRALQRVRAQRAAQERHRR